MQLVVGLRLAGDGGYTAGAGMGMGEFDCDEAAKVVLIAPDGRYTPTPHRPTNNRHRLSQFDWTGSQSRAFPCLSDRPILVPQSLSGTIWPRQPQIGEY